jgi:pimeloyl-ACP methyl ester carboxylesterase
MPKLMLRGAALEYVEQGDGDPIVLVHGSASDYRTWQAQMDAFAKRYWAIAYSRRYHWPNEPIAAQSDYSMEEHVRDLEALLGVIGPAPVHLVGHSYGAFVSMLLAMRAPELLRTLTLAEPPAITLFTSSTPRPLELVRLLATRPRTAAAIIHFGATGAGPATAAARRGDLDGAMHIFGNAVLGRAFYARLSARRLEQVRANAIGAEFLGSGFAPLDDDALRAVRTPTLLIGGAHSPAVFRRVLDRLEELVPRAERITIPAASHIMHEDNPDAFNAAVLSFLAAHASPERAAERGGQTSKSPFK